MDDVDIFAKSISIVVSTIKANGALGVLVIYIFYDKYWLPNHKKKKGKSGSLDDTDTEITGVRMRVASLENKVDHHLELEAEENIMLAEMKAEQAHLKEKIGELRALFEKLEENQTAAFSLISKMKDRMLDQK